MHTTKLSAQSAPEIQHHQSHHNHHQWPYICHFWHNSHAWVTYTSARPSELASSGPNETAPAQLHISPVVIVLCPPSRQPFFLRSQDLGSRVREMYLVHHVLLALLVIRHVHYLGWAWVFGCFGCWLGGSEALFKPLARFPNGRTRPRRFLRFKKYIWLDSSLLFPCILLRTSPRWRYIKWASSMNFIVQ